MNQRNKENKIDFSKGSGVRGNLRILTVRFDTTGNANAQLGSIPPRTMFYQSASLKNKIHFHLLARNYIPLSSEKPIPVPAKVNLTAYNLKDQCLLHSINSTAITRRRRYFFYRKSPSSARTSSSETVKIKMGIKENAADMENISEKFSMLNIDHKADTDPKVNSQMTMSEWVDINMKDSIDFNRKP